MVSDKIPTPGVSRAERISDEGLRRLEIQLSSDRKVSSIVLAQWIRRYGEPARVLIRQYGCYTDDMG